MVGRQFFFNIRGPTAGCFCLPACINLCGPVAAVPAQGASQHLELKSRGEERDWGAGGFEVGREMSTRGQKILGNGCLKKLRAENEVTSFVGVKGCNNLAQIQNSATSIKLVGRRIE